MRRFIKDQKLLFILDQVESHFGRPVIAITGKHNERESSFFAVQPIFEEGDDSKNYYWAFLAHKESASAETICHELLHLIFNVEGWPILCSKSDTSQNLYITKLIGFIGSLPEHILIYPRQHILGFGDGLKQRHEDECLAMQNMIKRRTLVPSLTEAESINVQGATLAHLILVQETCERKGQLLQDAREYWPELMPVATKIINIFNDNMPMTAISGAIAAKKSCEFLGIPEEYFFHRSVDAKEISFFEQICKHFQAIKC